MDYIDVPIGELVVVNPHTKDFGVGVKEPRILQITGLSSCMAIVLYDPRHKIAGLAHAVLSIDSLSSSEVGDTRYIEVAIDEMLKRMQSMGSRKDDIEAKIIGGANLFTDIQTDFIMRNITKTREKLKKEGIRIAGELVGGNLGRQVEFDTSTGIVTVKIKF